MSDSCWCTAKPIQCCKVIQFSSVRSLSHVRLFATPWMARHQASLSYTNSRSSLRLTSIQQSHALSSPSPPAPNLSQHQSLFQWVNSSYEVAKVLEFQLQHQSFQRNLRADLLQNGLVGSLCSPRDSEESSPTPQFKSIHSSALSFLHSPEWTSWISLQSKGLSRVFSNTTVQKHQFFSAQPSSQSKSHIHTWPQEKP